MFGYITINKPELKVREYYQYKAYYCGLCKVLKERHGRLGQVTLTYDMTFLIILLTSLYESKTHVGQERCMLHPMKKHGVLTNEITEYASDMNIALAYHNFEDDYIDDKSMKGYVGTKVFQRKYKKIEKKYPRQCEVMKKKLKKLLEFEASNETNLDAVSACFGELMAELFIYQNDEWEGSLRKFGCYLGKFIYLIDAYEDLEQDLKNGSYNPFRRMHESEIFDEECKQILTMMMAECSNEFEKLPIVRDVELLRNILYAGVWIRYDNFQKKKNEQRKEHKK